MAEPNEPPHTADPPETFLLRHLSLIERMAASFARQRRLQKTEVEDFQSWVKVKLLEDDYRRIRAYRGDCSPQPFLAVTVSRLGKDFLDKIWRRWHPSAKAIELGQEAIWLERLLFHDGCKLDEACEVLRSRHGVTLSRGELETIYRALPPRTPPRPVNDDCLEGKPSRDPNPEEAALSGEAARRRMEVLGCLKRATRSLPPDERLFLRLHVGEGMTVAEIARNQKLDQKSLYRRKEKILLTLREILGREGVRKDEIDPLF